MPKIMLNSVEYTGGGGGDSGMELTYDEYLALPEEEKTNGTTYYIKDINDVGEDQFQPVIYSTNEREIGVWIDGKPLYQKTYHLASTVIISPNTWVSLGISGDGIDVIINKEVLDDENRSTAVEYIAVRDGYINVLSVREINVQTITIQYTKTADTAGSGTWTPQGVPAHHYSTDEQVVGTWVDGSTLYEKTIVKQNISSASSSTVLISSSELTGMNIIEISGSYVSRTSNSTYAINTYINSNTIIATWLAEGDIYYWLYWGAADIYDAYITIRYTKS